MKITVLRTLAGIGIAFIITFAITLGISWSIGDGVFYPVVPAAVSSFGSELGAVTFLFASTICYGALWGLASMIWENEKWSLLKKTVIHFAIVAGGTFPIMWFNIWVPHTVEAIAGYFLIFIAIYAAIWCGTYFSNKAQVKQLNKVL